jgi:hypothetical protein
VRHSLDALVHLLQPRLVGAGALEPLRELLDLDLQFRSLDRGVALDVLDLVAARRRRG